ncbi:MAG: acyl-CoA thioesterase [Treponema sp.]|jgi:acyl-CoA thioester hydrolase|nr:acyl-CoA thioesterase [Treponema sp.]
MFSTIVTPRFGDMDVLGHINNTVLAAWFELARNPFFTIFAPKTYFTDGTFMLIMAHTDYDYLSELHFGEDVEIRSWVKRVGTKSFTVYHEAWQGGQRRAKGDAVIVHYDFNGKVTTPLPEEKKALLAEHLLPAGYPV